VHTLWLTQAGWAVVDRILKINKKSARLPWTDESGGTRNVLEALGHMKSNLAVAEEVMSTTARDPGARRTARQSEGCERSRLPPRRQRRSSRSR